LRRIILGEAAPAGLTDRGASWCSERVRSAAISAGGSRKPVGMLLFLCGCRALGRSPNVASRFPARLAISLFVGGRGQIRSRRLGNTGYRRCPIPCIVLNGDVVASDVGRGLNAARGCKHSGGHVKQAAFEPTLHPVRPSDSAGIFPSIGSVGRSTARSPASRSSSLHGVPGAGGHNLSAWFFNPQRYRVVLFDQRGCGKRTPSASDDDATPALTDNTTRHLIDDV
jgi:hypothetical protein